MQNKIVFDFSDINVLNEQTQRLEEKASALVAEGKHAQAADYLEMASCAHAIRGLADRMSYLLSKCPCCYEPVTMN